MGTRSRRLVEAAAFVAVWVALGYLLPIGANAYLLLGIPLTVGFQLLVRRRPLRELWVRDASRLTIDRAGLALAAALLAAPAYFAMRALGDAGWSTCGWWLATMAGALPAALALRAGNLRPLLRAAVLPTSVGVGASALVYTVAHVATGTPVDALAALGTGGKYLLLYFPLTFVVEEVTFRGALDTHVHGPGEDRAWQTAVFVSALWGLWHLPVSGGMPLPLLVGELLVWHCLLGAPMSFAWRRTGNLAVPAFAHAAADAVRNALMLGL